MITRRKKTSKKSGLSYNNEIIEDNRRKPPLNTLWVSQENQQNLLVLKEILENIKQINEKLNR